MIYALSHHDANGTDGKDPAKMFAVYRVNGQEVRVPADLSGAALEEAICAKLGTTVAAENARLARLADAVSADSKVTEQDIDGLGLNAVQKSIFKRFAKNIARLREDIDDLRSRLPTTTPAP